MADDRARVLFTEAQSLKKQGEVAQATALLEEARSLAPESLGILAELGILYRDQKRDEEAIQCLETYILRKPDSPPILFALGNLLISQGVVTRGVELLEQAIGQDPQLVPALLALSRAKGEVLTESHIAILKKCLEREDLDIGNKSSVCFALAASHDTFGSEDQAFEYWQQANAYRYSTLHDKKDTHIASMMAMRKLFSSEFIKNSNRSHVNDRLPIFVVGMPRSGTSLVEQILASHSHVFGAGELKDLVTVVQSQISKVMGEPLIKAIRKCSSTDLDNAANHYLQALRAHDPEAKRIVDKMPHNFIMIGIILFMLPGATIINLKRDPIDTCWSVFKTPLKSDHPYSFRLEDIAQHYLKYRMLMDHWYEMFPGRIHEVQYEDLVTHPKRETEKLLAACGLDFEDACLEFHQTSRPVGTASEFQVRKPMYTSSVGAWKPYAKHLSLWTEMFKELD